MWVTGRGTGNFLLPVAKGSYTLGDGGTFPRIKDGLSVKIKTHPNIVPKLSVSGVLSSKAFHGVFLRFKDTFIFYSCTYVSLRHKSVQEF
jgi:hypothetical protein